MLSITLRSLAFICFLALIGFAWLQINDPDPIPWTGYYVLCALVPLLVTFNRFYHPFFWLTLILTLLVIGIYTPGTLDYLRHVDTEPLMQSMNPQKPYIEEAREFLGAAITLGILLLSRLIVFWKK